TQGGEVEADKRGGDDRIHPGGCIGDIEAAQLADHAQNPGDQDAVEDGALDPLHQHHGDDQHADQSQDGADAHAVEGLALKALVGQQGRIAVDDQLGVLQAHKGDEEADAHADGGFEGGGDGVENGLPHVGQGQQNEDDALCKDGHQGQLPGVTHLQHYGVGEVGVQAHAGGQGKGIVGQQGHQGGADEGGQGSGDQDGV